MRAADEIDRLLAFESTVKSIAKVREGTIASLRAGEANRDALILTLISERDALREQLGKAKQTLNEIFRYSHEQHIYDLALKDRNELGALTDENGKS